MILPTAPNMSQNGERSGEGITYADVANHALITFTILEKARGYEGRYGSVQIYAILITS